MAERISWDGWEDHIRRRGNPRIYKMTVDNRQNLDGVMWCLESPDAIGEFCATVMSPTERTFQNKVKYFYFTDRRTAFFFKLMFHRPPAA